MSLRAENDEHLVTLLARSRFNFVDVRKVLFEFLYNSRSQFAVRHLAAAKPDSSFYLIAVLQPLARVFHAIVVVVVIGAGAKLYFLDRNRYLFLLRLVRL